MASDINSNTVGGLVVYCDWLIDKGYAGPSQVGPWKIAVRKVFEALHGPDEYEAVSLEGMDLDDAFRRFRTLTAATYKSESQDAYEARVRRAIEAFEYWQANSRPPVFRQVGKKAEGGETPKPKAKKTTKTQGSQNANSPTPPEEFIEYPFPLRDGKIAKLHLPPRLEKSDVDRMVQLLHALSFEPQAQIPERTGEQLAA